MDQDAVSSLMRCEADNIQLKNCPAHIREWITRERSQSQRLFRLAEEQHVGPG